MDAAGAAKEFAAARKENRALDALPAGLPADASLADGYAVQDAMMAAASAPDGGPLGAVVGWKIGATNAGAQAAMGFGPFYGPLFASSKLADGASCSLSSLGALKAAEAEFAFILRADLAPRGDAAAYTEAEVWAAVEAVCPAIELAAARLVGPAPPAGVLADSAWNGCFVVGARVAPGDVPNGPAGLAAARAALLVNGAEVAANTGANVLGNPLTALTWLANALSAAGHTLRAGHVVMTGAAAAHKVLAAGDALAARFEGLGPQSLTVSLTATA